MQGYRYMLAMVPDPSLAVDMESCILRSISLRGSTHLENFNFPKVCASVTLIRPGGRVSWLASIGIACQRRMLGGPSFAGLTKMGLGTTSGMGLWSSKTTVVRQCLFHEDLEVDNQYYYVSWLASGWSFDMRTKATRMYVR